MHLFTVDNLKRMAQWHNYGIKPLKDKFKTSFVLCKSRFAPLKNLTFPRLELMGAFIGSRVANYL